MVSTNRYDDFALNRCRSLVVRGWEQARVRGDSLFVDLICYPADEGTGLVRLPTGVESDYHIGWDDCDVIVVWFDCMRAFPDRRAAYHLGMTLATLPREKTVFATADLGALLAAYPDLEDPLAVITILSEITSAQAAVDLLVRLDCERLPAYLWKPIRERILLRDNHTCYYCETTDAEMHVDHVVPLSRGGSNNDDNLVAACAACNLSKSDKLLREWIR